MSAGESSIGGQKISSRVPTALMGGWLGSTRGRPTAVSEKSDPAAREAERGKPSTTSWAEQHLGHQKAAAGSGMIWKNACWKDSKWRPRKVLHTEATAARPEMASSASQGEFLFSMRTAGELNQASMPRSCWDWRPDSGGSNRQLSRRKRLLESQLCTACPSHR